MTSVEAIREAARICGGLRALERAAKLPRSTLNSRMSRRKRPIPVEIAIAVSRATGGAVKIGDIIPHVVEAVRDELRRDGADSQHLAA